MELFFEIEPTIGENLCIETDYFDTVLQIKEKIQKHRGIPISDQTLVFKRRIMKDDDLCIQYAEIPDKSHIRLLVATPDHATTSALPDNDSTLDEMIREVAAEPAGGVESTFTLPQPSNSAINETTTTTDHLHYNTATSSSISPPILDHHTERETRAYNSSQTCAACKYQRRRCGPHCNLAPYFPANRHDDFFNARKLYGVNNINKILQIVPEQQTELRDDAMTSVIFESNMRARDKVGGCYRLIVEMDRQLGYYSTILDILRKKIDVCRAQPRLILDDHISTPDFGNSTRSPLILDDHIINKTNFGYSALSPQTLDHHTNVSNFGYSVPSPPILDRTNVMSNFENSASSTSPLQSSLSADPAAFGFHPSSGNATPPLTPHLLQSSLSADPGFVFKPNFGNAAPLTPPLPLVSASPGSAQRGLKHFCSDRRTTEYSSPSTIKLLVKMPDASEQEIEFDVNEPMENLKEKIHKMVELDVPVDRLVVVVNGSDLPDHKSLLECQLTNISEIGVVILRPSPASTSSGLTSSGSSVDKLSIILLTECGAKRYSLMVNFSDTPDDLRRRLQGMKEGLELYVPDRFFFVHNKKRMHNDRSFRWHKASQGDEIQVFSGYITTDVYGRETLHFG